MRYRRRRGERPEHTDHLYVVSRRHQYLGRIALQVLLTREANTPINQLIDDEQPATDVEESAEEVARQFSDHDWISAPVVRSEEHTSELQSLMRISYAVFCLNTKINNTHH